MASQLNFEKFKESFFEELDKEFSKYPKIAINVKGFFEKAEFQNQSEYDSRCRRCGTKFNVSDFPQCPDCGSHSIERNF